MKKLFPLLIVVCFLIAAVPAVNALSDEDAAYKAQHSIDGWRFTKIYDLRADSSPILLPFVKTGGLQLELYFAYNNLDVPHAYIMQHDASLSHLQKTVHSIEKIPSFIDNSLKVIMHIDSSVELVWVNFGNMKHNLIVKCDKNGNVTYKLEQT